VVTSHLAPGAVALLEPSTDDVELWTPLPGPQLLALNSAADELFYGGQPGGGKSDLILGAAATRHRASIIFRREFTQFEGAEGLIARSQQIIGMRGKFAKRVWRNLPGGRSIEFGAVNRAVDLEKYRGRPHDLKAFDELPQLPKAWYKFLLGWMRTAVPGQRVRAIGTGNPPSTPDQAWVIEYWGPWLNPRHPNPAAPGELRWFADVDGVELEVAGPAPLENKAGERVKPRSRTFIPARLEDNPYYVATGYGDVLDSLPEPLRSQLRRGDFQAASPDDPWQVIPTSWIKAAQERWRPDGHRGRPVTQRGVDPSRGGPDEFVLADRHDEWVAPLTVFPGSAAPTGKAGASLIARHVGTERRAPIGIDVIGSAGSSVFDSAVLLKLRAVDLNGSRSSSARDRSGLLGFVNARAAWHWYMREALDPDGGMDVALPPDPQLLADLSAPRWTVTPRGIQVEKKEDIKKRLGRSPDRGESVIYAFAEPSGFLLFAQQEVEAAGAGEKELGAQAWGESVSGHLRCRAAGWTAVDVRGGRKICRTCGEDVGGA
jgi:hypothetical protein